MKPLAMQGLKTPRTNAYAQTFPRNEMTFIQALKKGRVQYTAKAVSREDIELNELIKE